MDNEYIEMSEDGSFEIPEVKKPPVKKAAIVPATIESENNEYILPKAVEIEKLETDGVFQGISEGEYKVFSHSVDGKYNVDIVVAVSSSEEISKVYLNKDYDLTVVTDSRKLVINLNDSIDEQTRAILRESTAEKCQNYVIVRLTFHGK